jgi:hypothetical protein
MELALVSDWVTAREWALGLEPELESAREWALASEPELVLASVLASALELASESEWALEPV